LKSGRLPENVLKRSILKKIDFKHNETSRNMSFGEYCAFFHCDGPGVTVSEESCSDELVNTGHFLVDKLVNNLAVKNSVPIGVIFSLTVPESMEEAELKTVSEMLGNASKQAKVAVLGVNTRVSAKVTAPIISATMFGNGDEEFTGKASPGDDVIVTKWVGLEGTHIIASKKEKELLNKFPSHLIYDAINFDRFISIVPEAATAIKSGASAVYGLSEGGIFAGLWELAEICGVGLDIVLRDIPLKQETVEICNYFDLNPYALLSGGSLLITAPDGNRLVMELNKAGIEAAIIGKCTDSNDRVLINEEIRRFIEPAKQDEIYSIL